MGFFLKFVNVSEFWYKMIGILNGYDYVWVEGFFGNSVLSD